MGKSQKSRKVQKRFSRKSKYGGSKMYLLEGGADKQEAGTGDKPKLLQQNIIDKVNKLEGEKTSKEIVDYLFEQAPDKLKTIITNLINDSDMDKVSPNNDKYIFFIINLLIYKSYNFTV